MVVGLTHSLTTTIALGHLIILCSSLVLQSSPSVNCAASPHVRHQVEGQQGNGEGDPAVQASPAITSI